MARGVSLLALMFLLEGCMVSPELIVGGIYTIDNGDGSIGAAKILVIEGEVIHVRIYKSKWRDRPYSVDLSTLSLGTIHDKDGFGIGDVPLTKRGFLNWKPLLVATQAVSTDELGDYNEEKKDQAALRDH